MLLKRPDLTLQLVLLTIGIIVCGVFGRWNDDSDESRDDEIKEIKETLRILTNEVIQLKREFGEFKGDQQKISQKTDKNESNSDGGVQIISVSRETVIGGKSRYTIRYQLPQNSSMPLHAFWREFHDYKYNLLQEMFSNEVPNLPPGVFETSITTTVGNHSHLMVSLGQSNQHWLSLFLRNDDSQDLIETNVKIPLLDITPRGDIVYELGHNTTVTVVHPLEIEKEGPGGGMLERDNFNAYYVITKPEDDAVMVDSSSGDLFDLIDKTKFLDKIKIEFVVNTEDTSYSGLISMYSGINKKNGIVQRIVNHREIVLRPSTQKGPFPNGKIYTTDTLYSQAQNENGDVIRFCSFGETCQFYCQFYGTDLSTLELFKTINGKTTPEHLETINSDLELYNKAGQFEVSPVISDPFPVTYTCVASNVEGQTLSSKSVVYFGINVDILENETSKELFDNGTAKLVCTARGLPLPNVTIQCNGNDLKSDIVYQSNDVIRVKAMCNDVTHWAWSTCTVENDYTSDFYDFQILSTSIN